MPNSFPIASASSPLNPLRNPPTFVVDYPRRGKFTAAVGRVSRAGLLKVWVDDELKLEREFPCGEKIGKQWTYQSKWNLWESVYDEDVSVDVPVGKHRIRVDNLGKDWMRVTRYVFAGCKVLDHPNPPSQIVLEGFTDGAYKVEWWDAWKGRPTGTEKVVAENGKLVLQTGVVKTDTAAKINRP